MSKSDDDFICPDCVGDGEVQCVNLGPTYRSDTLPCPTCIAHEIEQERASKADEITRLTAEVEDAHRREACAADLAREWEQHCKTAEAGITRLTAENEKLGRDYDTARDAHDRLLAENEKLRAALERAAHELELLYFFAISNGIAEAGCPPHVQARAALEEKQ